MKLVQFWKDNAPALGLMTEGGIVDAAAEGARRGFAVPTTMEEAIAQGAEGLTALNALCEGAQCFTTAPLAPVVTNSSKILCIGLNYRQHAKECSLPLPPCPGAVQQVFHRSGRPRGLHQAARRIQRV